MTCYYLALISVIANIFNNSLEKGEFASIWKTAVIRPLPKVANITSLDQLRPISILPIIGKMLEMLVSDMVHEFIGPKHILPDIQSGFRAGHSTATALSKVTSDISRNMDLSLISCLVLLDYSKAFDLVDHDMLIAKLHYCGFSPEACGWFLGYLGHRRQIVEVDGVRADPSDIQCGVPQGSILGPLLFLIYTSDLPSQVRSCSVHLYADDTQLLSSFKPEDAGRELSLINDDLERIFSWSTKHGLLLNARKSVYLVIGSESARSKFYLFNFVSLHMNGVVVPCVDQARNLGLIFDVSLKFESHVLKKLSVIYLKMKSLYPFKYLLPQHVKIMLVESLIFSQLDYCDVVYYSYLTVEFQRKIQLAQNSCMRFVYGGGRFDHITPVYVAGGHLKFNLRVDLHFALFMHHIVNKDSPEYLVRYLVARRDLHNLNLRNVIRFHVPAHYTQKFRSCFAYRAVDFLNSDIFFSLTSASRLTFRVEYLKLLRQRMLTP